MRLNIGSAATGGAKSGGCSIFGIFFGILLVPLGFYLVYHGEVNLINHGKVFEGVEMMTSQAALSTKEGTVKFKGVPEAEFLTVEYYDKAVIYFSRTLEEYEREEDEDGEVDYDWNTKDSASKFADFTVDSIKVGAAEAKPVGATKVFEGIKPVNAWRDYFDPKLVGTRSPEVGDQRLTVRVIDAGEELIVFGDIVDGTVAGGTTFVISALGDQATTDALKTEYKIWYWVFKGGAVFCIGFGILAIFGPLLALVGYIPFIGDKISGAFGCAAFAFALVSVLVVTLLIKLFWVIVILAVVGIGVGIAIAIKSPRTPPGAPPEAGAQTPPPTPTPTPTPTPEPTPEEPQDQ